MTRNVAVIWCVVLAAVACMPAGGARATPSLWLGTRLRDNGAGYLRDSGGGGPRQEKVQQKDEPGDLPAGPTARPTRPSGAPPDAAGEADRLLQENVQLRDRVRALEQQARRAQELEAELAQLRAGQDAAREQVEAHRRALAGALRDFFETASLMDQALQLAQSRSLALRQVGVRVNPVPDVGYITQQLRLAATVRVTLCGQQEVDGVPIRDVDQPVAARAIAGALVPQSAIYLNAYAMGRLRDLSDSPGFPTALRDLLHAAPLIYEVAPPPPMPATSATQPGASPPSPGTSPAPSVVSPAAPQVTAPAVLPELGGTNLTGVGQDTGGSSFIPGGPPARSALVPGSDVIPFAATDVNGKTFRFPQDYSGKIVLLDFWATWCQPCLREVPALLAAYTKYHSHGLEIIGVSVDQPGQIATLRQFLGQNQLNWPQIYDGKGWGAGAAVLYSVRVVPYRYLANGTTGKILAYGSVLRGSLLDSALSRYFAGRS